MKTKVSSSGVPLQIDTSSASSAGKTELKELLIIGTEYQRYVYCESDRLGFGRFGQVYLARDLQTNAVVAIKRVLLYEVDECSPKVDPEADRQWVEERDEGVQHNVLRELAALSQSCHANIVPLLHFVIEPHFMYYVFPYCPHTLHDKIRHSAKTKLSHAQIQRYSVDLLSGIAYLHNKRVMHRDLKPQNLLIDAADRLLIADLGWARQLRFDDDAGYTPGCMTHWYRAPELFLGESRYDQAVDMWSIGCILLELILGRPAWASDEAEQLQLMFQTLGSPTEHIWPGVSRLPLYPMVHPVPLAEPFYSRFALSAELVQQHSPLLDLIGQLLVYCPHKRCTASQALQHSYFTSP